MHSTRTEVRRRRGGQPGNQNGCKTRSLRELLLEIINAEDRRRLRQGLEAVIDKAATGDLDAMSFIFDRINGKPRQAVEMSGVQIEQSVRKVETAYRRHGQGFRRVLCATERQSRQPFTSRAVML